MGEHPRPGSEAEYKYKMLLHLSSKSPVTLYADLSDGLRAVLIPRHWWDPSKAKERLALPHPLSEYPCPSTGPFFYSRARLENVSQIRLCRDADRITGMVLYYDNDTRASLGRVSLEKLEAPKTVDACGLWLLAAYTEGPVRVARVPRIVSVLFAPPVSEAETHLHVQWRDELEWWSSSRQCRLHWKGKETLPTQP